jgi:hypothetical protein
MVGILDESDDALDHAARFVTGRLSEQLVG